jgi:hypothetical protein
LPLLPPLSSFRVGKIASHFPRPKPSNGHSGLTGFTIDGCGSGRRWFSNYRQASPRQVRPRRGVQRNSCVHQYWPFRAMVSLFTELG